MKPVDKNPTTTTQTATEPGSEQTTQLSTKPVKKHRILKIASLLLVVIISVPILVAGWLGFVPGLSNIMGARTAKDLGVVWTEADYESYLDKSGVSFRDISEAPVNPTDPSKRVVFMDPKTVDGQIFTQEELTAAVNSVDWAWMPITNAQIKLSDGTVEVSGNLALGSIEQFVRFIGGVGYESDDVAAAADWGRRFVDGAPIYINADASVTDDVLTLALREVEIGRYSVPMDVANTVLYTGTSNSIKNAPHLEASSAKLTDGGINFSGTYPTTIFVRYEE